MLDTTTVADLAEMAATADAETVSAQ